MMDGDVYVDEELEPDPELSRITNLILGAAIEVHRELGAGYQESIYENALAMEFRRRGIRFARQVTSYLEATRKKLTLIINFNTRKLKDGIKRIAF